MVNRVILIGRLGQDPEVRRLENGAAVAKFSVATNESYKDSAGNWQDRTEWHDVVAWRYLAEKAETTLKKGSLVYVEGKLTHRKWQDKDGNNRRSTEVVANYFRGIQSREGTAGGSGSGYFPSEADAPPENTYASSANKNQGMNTSPTPPASTPSVTPATTAEEVTDVAEDDLPF